VILSQYTLVFLLWLHTKQFPRDHSVYATGFYRGETVGYYDVISKEHPVSGMGGVSGSRFNVRDS